jgi:heme/copper-type cytochrome/quinol oxidase subunit 2
LANLESSLSVAESLPSSQSFAQIEHVAVSAAVSTLPVKKRSGYAAIQPGVGNMRRLRVTQGIYLPADLPIHGIFGSKDVIHSWAIPGLGVKVDCIPGYSSHRRLFFR